MYAVFENEGTLDFRAMTVMGINSKPNHESPFGFFGTGMKYAIAVLARSGCELHIQDGCGQEYRVDTYDSTFRDKQFQMLRLLNVNDDRDYVDLPFTTELGKNWQLWMVLRELECNMRDENGKYSLLPQRLPTVDGVVRFIVSGVSFIEYIAEMRKMTFFDVANERRDVQSFQDIEFVQRPSTSIYMHNVRVSDFQKPFAFSYNIKQRMDITEDRTLKYVWEIDTYISSLFCHGPSSYRQGLFDDEHANEWAQISFPTNEYAYSEEAIREIDAHHERGGFLSETVKQMVFNRRVRLALEHSRELQENEEEMLQEAIERLDMLGYDVGRYKIIHSNKLPGKVLGLANYAKKTINISQRCFEEGLECLMGTLLEEFAHLEYHYTDNSRLFQDWLLRQTISNGQRYLRQLKRDKVYDGRLEEVRQEKQVREQARASEHPHPEVSDCPF